jgi:peptidoglycan/xylan/chitin deacetylase (PgdA/CDA1 family)
MSLRSDLRALLIRSTALARADELALRLQKRRIKSKALGIVVAIHETPKALEARFRAQLEWVSRHFAICDFTSFIRTCQKSESHPNSKPPILFTFDDGRESNYQVAAPLLESFGARGLFFTVPAFAECSPDAALNFYRARINPNSRPGDEKWEDWKPMSPAQIAELAARGHSIGNHTLTHSRLSSLSLEKLEQEIGESARKLAAWTSKPVDSFAWTFAWDSIDANAFAVIQRHHRYCFAPCAGTIDFIHGNPSLFWRREIEVKYAPAEYRFFYSGLADPWWSTRRSRLCDMLQLSHSNITKRVSTGE